MLHVCCYRAVPRRMTWQGEDRQDRRFRLRHVVLLKGGDGRRQEHGGKTKRKGEGTHALQLDLESRLIRLHVCIQINSILG